MVSNSFGLNAFDDYNAFTNELIKLLTDEKYWLKNQAAFENFINWVGESYPETERVLSREHTHNAMQV